MTTHDEELTTLQGKQGDFAITATHTLKSRPNFLPASPVNFLSLP